MRSALSLIARPLLRQPTSIPLRRLPATQHSFHLSATTNKSTQGYGDPSGSPEATTPRSKQSSTSKAQTQGEHPGPAPVGQGGSKDTKSPSEASATSGGSRSKDAAEKHDAAEKNEGQSGGDGASKQGSVVSDGPPIRASGSGNPGEGLSGGKAEEVEQHNRDFEEGYGRGENAQPEKEREGDKVGKKFWKGHGGVENDVPDREMK